VVEGSGGKKRRTKGKGKRVPGIGKRGSTVVSLENSVEGLKVEDDGDGEEVDE
jgi:hypothetical protein